MYGNAVNTITIQYAIFTCLYGNCGRFRALRPEPVAGGDILSLLSPPKHCVLYVHIHDGLRYKSIIVANKLVPPGMGAQVGGGEIAYFASGLEDRAKHDPRRLSCNIPNSRLGLCPSDKPVSTRKGATRMQNNIVAGIDVSKSKADLCILPDGIVATFSLNDDGIASLIEALKASAVNLAVMEATGGYEAKLAAAIFHADIPVAVVNPRQVRSYARAIGQSAKTDRLDAEVIARFAQDIKPQPRVLPDAKAAQIRELIDRRRQLMKADFSAFSVLSVVKSSPLPIRDPQSKIPRTTRLQHKCRGIDQHCG
jgi:hypothetical protein